VEQGVVKLSCLDVKGGEAIVGIAAPGMVFGRGLSSLEVYQATAIAEATLTPITLADVEASAELAPSLFPSLIQRIQQTEALLAIAGQRPIELRLQQLLLLLAQTVGQPVVGGIRLGVRLTHEELACLTRSSRVTITQSLSQFKRQGWLKVDHKHHLVLEQAAISEFEERTGFFRLDRLTSPQP